MKLQHRAKRIIPGISMLISRRALAELNKNRTSLAKELIGEIKTRFPDEIPPTVETLKKKISKVRSGGLDHKDTRFWSIASLKDYDLSPEAVQIVFELQEYLLNKRLQNRAVDSPKLLTVREAYWASKLTSLIASFFKNDERDAMLDSLEHWAREYADLERGHERTDMVFNTYDLDRLVYETKGRYGFKTPDELIKYVSSHGHPSVF